MNPKVYKQECWSLADLFASIDSPEIQTAQTDLETILDEFEGYREKLSPELDEKLFLSIIEDYEKAVKVLAQQRLAHSV